MVRVMPMSFHVIETASLALPQADMAEDAGGPLPSRIFVLHGHPAHLAMAACDKDVSYRSVDRRHHGQRLLRQRRARLTARPGRGR